MDEARWQSPSHQISIEVDTPRGVQRRMVAGIRSPKIFDSLAGEVLTDKKIDKHVGSGFYEMRSEYLKKKREVKATQDIFPRLVYDPSRQDFITI